MEKNILKQISLSKLKELYGNNIEDNILERYNFEITSIFQNKFEDIYYQAYMIAKKAKEDEEIMIIRGSGSSSFIAYLLGISYINPIEFNIPFETFANIEGSKKPDFNFEFTTKCAPKIEKYLNDLLSEENIFSDIKILSSTILDMIKELEINTGIKHTDINLKDKELINVFNIDVEGIKSFDTEHIKKIIDKVKPKNIDDLIKIFSLEHGTALWDNNNEELINEHSIDELACSRDDVFLYLLEKGIKRKTAFEISEFVRKGKASPREEQWKEYLKIMKQYEIPNWYITSLEKAIYMFPKAHSCNYVYISLILAWYKIYYLQEFIKVKNKYNR